MDPKRDKQFFAFMIYVMSIVTIGISTLVLFVKWEMDPEVIRLMIAGFIISRISKYYIGDFFDDF